MTRHLSEDVLLELAETGKSHPHAEDCTACRRQVEELREAITAARQVAVPEPSPLFWDHLSARIRAGVGFSESRASHAVSGLVPGRFVRRFAYVTAALLLLAAGVWRVESARRHQQAAVVRPGAVAAPSAPNEQADLVSSEAATDDASWELVTDVAATVDLDTATEAAGMSLQPGAAERAALQLSPDEQRELIRLLQAAVEQPE